MGSAWIFLGQVIVPNAYPTSLNSSAFKCIVCGATRCETQLRTYTICIGISSTYLCISIVNTCYSKVLQNRSRCLGVWVSGCLLP
ncbi:hypothetical protein F4815DRAFT_471639 [Daldinia loculata]|nr:hypothetical protein F4815DRAFT_471639 [Daldinia loculata]